MILTVSLIVLSITETLLSLQCIGKNNSVAILLTPRNDGDSPAQCLHFLQVILLIGCLFQLQPLPLCSQPICVFSLAVSHSSADTQMDLYSSNKSAETGVGKNCTFSFSISNFEQESQFLIHQNLTNQDFVQKLSLVVGAYIYPSVWAGC